MYHKKKIFFWSPLLSHVGTINAVEKSAKALIRYLNCEIYLINVFGEFDYLKDNKDFIILNIFSYRNWPKTGFLSKFIIYSFSFLSVFKLVKFYNKYVPDLIFCNLVGYLPNILKFFFPKLIIINSIQGLPKFSFFRRFLWNLFYTKADYIFTMTEATKKNILKNINYKNKILKVDNPIITRNIRNLSNKLIISNDKEIFKGITFCSVGRLTRQKNFLEIIKAVNIIPQELHSKFRVIIIGDGEDFDDLSNYLKKYNLQNIFFLGFKSNPFQYIKNSNYFISSSLWEEPGHAILEAGYLNKLIISSDCPNGPREILKDNFNSIKYNSGDYNKLSEIIQTLLKGNIKNELFLRLNMKKMVRNYTMIKFAKKIKNILN